MRSTQIAYSAQLAQVASPSPLVPSNCHCQKIKSPLNLRRISSLLSLLFPPFHSRYCSNSSPIIVGNHECNQTPVAEDLREAENEASQQGTVAASLSASPAMKGHLCPIPPTPHHQIADLLVLLSRYVLTAVRRTRRGRPSRSASIYAWIALPTTATLVCTSLLSDQRISMVRAFLPTMIEGRC